MIRKHLVLMIAGFFAAMAGAHAQDRAQWWTREDVQAECLAQEQMITDAVLYRLSTNNTATQQQVKARLFVDFKGNKKRPEYEAAGVDFYAGIVAGYGVAADQTALLSLTADRMEACRANFFQSAFAHKTDETGRDVWKMGLYPPLIRHPVQDQ